MFVCFFHVETLTLQERIETLEEENKQSLQQQASLQQAMQSAQNECKQLVDVQTQLKEKQELCNKLRNDVESKLIFDQLFHQYFERMHP